MILLNKKCAIYNRYSIENEKYMNMHREELIDYCKNILKIQDCEVFEDVGSVLKERLAFQKMLEKMKQGEFTDLLVYHPNRIYRAEYNKDKFDNIIKEISSYNVELHSIIQPKLQNTEELEEI